MPKLQMWDMRNPFKYGFDPNNYGWIVPLVGIVDQTSNQEEPEMEPSNPAVNKPVPAPVPSNSAVNKPLPAANASAANAPAANASAANANVPAANASAANANVPAANKPAPVPSKPAVNKPAPVPANAPDANASVPANAPAPAKPAKPAPLDPGRLNIDSKFGKPVNTQIIQRNSLVEAPTLPENASGKDLAKYLKDKAAYDENIKKNPRAVWKPGKQTPYIPSKNVDAGGGSRRIKHKKTRNNKVYRKRTKRRLLKHMLSKHTRKLR
jgi:hypothetical protein